MWDSLEKEFPQWIGTNNFLDEGVINFTCACGAWLKDTEMSRIESKLVDQLR